MSAIGAAFQGLAKVFGLARARPVAVARWRRPRSSSRRRHLRVDSGVGRLQPRRREAAHRVRHGLVWRVRPPPPRGSSTISPPPSSEPARFSTISKRGSTAVCSRCVLACSASGRSTRSCGLCSPAVFCTGTEKPAACSVSESSSLMAGSIFFGSSVSV